MEGLFVDSSAGDHPGGPLVATWWRWPCRGRSPPVRELCASRARVSRGRPSGAFLRSLSRGRFAWRVATNASRPWGRARRACSPRETVRVVLLVATGGEWSCLGAVRRRSLAAGGSLGRACAGGCESPVGDQAECPSAHSPAGELARSAAVGRPFCAESPNPCGRAGPGGSRGRPLPRMSKVGADWAGPLSVSGHEIVPRGGHVAARWRSTELPSGGQVICPR